MLSKRRLARTFLWSLPACAVLMQFIPSGRGSGNPPVVAEPPWDSPRTRELFLRTCGDCHSNQTVWPWYSAVAPVSWMLERDVREGREQLNVSEYGVRKDHGDDAARELEEGAMPPAAYRWLHPSARLTAEERAELLRGLEATFGARR